jgi:hypothetical protein
MSKQKQSSIMDFLSKKSKLSEHVSIEFPEPCDQPKHIKEDGVSLACRVTNSSDKPG